MSKPEESIEEIIERLKQDGSDEFLVFASGWDKEQEDVAYRTGTNLPANDFGEQQMRDMFLVFVDMIVDTDQSVDFLEATLKDSKVRLAKQHH